MIKYIIYKTHNIRISQCNPRTYTSLTGHHSGDKINITLDL